MAFFQVLRPNGEVAYTRAGAFKLDSAGNLVTSSGYPLEPPITVPADTEAISIGGDGTVAVIVAGETEPQEIGQIAQGVLELSNVEVGEEMEHMITASALMRRTVMPSRSPMTCCRWRTTSIDSA